MAANDKMTSNMTSSASMDHLGSFNGASGVATFHQAGTSLDSTQMSLIESLNFHTCDDPYFLQSYPPLQPTDVIVPQPMRGPTMTYSPEVNPWSQNRSTYLTSSSSNY